MRTLRPTSTPGYNLTIPMLSVDEMGHIIVYCRETLPIDKQVSHHDTIITLTVTWYEICTSFVLFILVPIFKCHSRVMPLFEIHIHVYWYREFLS